MARDMRNLKLAGESVGYDERHYKHALDRLVSFFQPQLRPVTERMAAIELARFLLNLNVPDSEYDNKSDERTDQKGWRENPDSHVTLVSVRKHYA